MGKKSIFRKQMVVHMGILLISFLLLGATLSMFFANYYMRQKEEQLMEQGEKLANQFKETFFTGTVDYKTLNYHLTILEEYLGASVFFMNKNGEVNIVSSGINQSWIGQTITNDAIDVVLDGKIATVKGKLNGMFPEAVLTVGYPIMIAEKSLGGIFMCVSIPEIQKSIVEMYEAGLISMLATMAAGVLLVYWSSLKISRPLMEMNHAAKLIASGDFARRIEIESDDEVGQLAESFNNMAESLNEHEQVRRDFIANVSHDLRSPLTSIQGFVNAILDGTIPQEHEKRYLQIVLEETDRLVKLTNNIVDLSRAQQSGITLEKTVFGLNDLIRDVMEKMQPRFLEKNIQAEVLFAQEETEVFADPEKIQRVLQNLLDNALKFTPEQGHIGIETTLPKEKGKVFITVSDNGKGISEENQRHIFDRFFKADLSRGEDKKGGGLGLAIVKEFILAHQESISVRSKEGEGAAFTFTLMLAEPQGKKEK